MASLNKPNVLDSSIWEWVCLAKEHAIFLFLDPLCHRRRNRQESLQVESKGGFPPNVRRGGGADAYVRSRLYPTSTHPITIKPKSLTTTTTRPISLIMKSKLLLKASR